ncbi:sulfurtransferase [Sphingomonas astaxanthinifaciens]|uniref:Sulfurtransferase n=1 Tax=Sphingomonas astaxanthinifaciens DSM 22298 TaxID=1123267 RepID=A0ABQ5Z6Y5_9SPHN|nr:sulfurtransferase [Sphingomonas astaxanthinifaciens]GLR47292.1 sulfurtransferase [Sphingomonas astaxanthinifaciens DSM 22298]
MDDLVSVEWLAANLRAADLVVLDASWHLPAANRDPRQEYEARHIPGARFFDIDMLADHDAATSHMLPSAEAFGAGMEALGVGRDDRIVVYDDSALRTSARAWFMLRHYGARQVAILDGGLAAWLAAGQPVTDAPPPGRPARFAATAQPGEVVTKRDLLQGVGVPVADARGPGRFAGSEPEPRPGVEPGHIPGARNLPFSALYGEDGRFRPVAELRRAFAAAGIDPERPFVATCGSGVTANSLIFAARLIGNRDTRLYDGSWSEWGSDPQTPKEQG